MFDMGKRICKLRRDAHLSQKQLGDYLLYGEKGRTLPLQKMSENRVQLLTDLAQEFAAPTSHGAAFSDRKLDILRRLYQEFYR